MIHGGETMPQLTNTDSMKHVRTHVVDYQSTPALMLTSCWRCLTDTQIKKVNAKLIHPLLHRLAKLKGTPTSRPEGLPEEEAEPAPPPPPKGPKGRKGSKVPAASILSGEDNASGSAAAAGEPEEERWIDYRGEFVWIERGFHRGSD